MVAYSMSKAALHKYVEVLARENSHLQICCVSPGMTATNMTAGMKLQMTTPDISAQPILHCMFNRFTANGWYYGPDGVRSPLDKNRNPGDPAFQGY